MKICLISPPTVVEFNEWSLSQAEAARLIFEHAPMGILSLGAVLDQQQVAVQIVDLNSWYYDYVIRGCRTEGLDFCDYAARELGAVSADVFGFSTICGSYPLTLRLAGAVSENHPDAMILMGGPQASVVDQPTLENFSFVDIVVRGEAEETLPRVLDALSHPLPGLERIPGITYRRSRQVIRNPNAPVIEDLDALPLPAFHLYSQIEGCSYAPLEAGRGCPFACSFCSTNDFFRRRFRMKSPDVLVDQMKTIKERYGINSFDLIHDMFTVDRKKVVSFCNALAESGEDLYWGCSARTDCIDNDLIDLMSANGCIGYFFGIDSGSDNVQAQIQKRLDLSEAAERIKYTSRRGIKHTVSLITGFPEETKEDLRGTIKFIGEALRHQHAKFQLHLLAPLAETPITSQYQDELIFDDIFSDMSLQGWDQVPQEREMIIKYPKIFPNFYGVPTRWLDRQYLRELREFLLHGILKFRWLMVLLHRERGDLLQVFDDWVKWSATARVRAGKIDTSRRYYAGEGFRNDLNRFVNAQYIKSSPYPHLIQTMVAVETAPYKFGKDENGSGPIIIQDLASVPRIAARSRLIVVNADYKRLVRALKRNERLEHIPNVEVPLGLIRNSEETKVVQLNETVYELMRLCDGSNSINDIAKKFSAAKALGVSPIKATVYGLASLGQKGFIEIQPVLN